MSKLESPLTRWYWGQVGGLLIEEFRLVDQGSANSARFADGLILLGEETRIANNEPLSILGRDVIVVQTKAKPLGMYLMGQCVFSLELVRRLGPRTVKSVALCTKDDAVLRPLLESHNGCEVVIVPESVPRSH